RHGHVLRLGLPGGQEHQRQDRRERRRDEPPHGLGHRRVLLAADRGSRKARSGGSITPSVPPLKPGGGGASPPLAPPGEVRSRLGQGSPSPFPRPLRPE